MEKKREDISVTEHDWHSETYVQQWIDKDIQRDAQRRPILRRMLALAECQRDAAISVLDVGGGYGVVTEEVLGAFPHARVTLQDYSEPMLARARTRLSAHADRVDFVQSDLCDKSWPDRIGKSFDLAVSAIAIHNLRGMKFIEECYRGIRRILKPGALFLDCDLFAVAGGVEKHLSAIKQAGFESVECAWEQAPLAIVKARR